ncbi:MAG: YHS domain-containing (seleno)protein [Microscillaceae bacterium]|nr:YHS domain-containing (seleno)protein [Microscillaceae bacterium]
MQTRFISNFLISLTLTFVLSAVFFQGHAQTVQQKQYNLSNNLAVQGYDVVSYFKNSPVKGVKTYETVYQGIVYRFANADNLKTFKANPAKYEPQYGGWCAYAMGKDGSKVDINPKTYKIHNGKLYLFYNAWGTNTLNYWNDDEANLQKKADLSWSKLIK